MTKIREALANVMPTIYNPDLMFDAVLDTMQNIKDGENVEIIDPNNPVAMTIESAVLTTYAGIEHQESCLRRAYPILASNRAELYPHMCEADFVDPFAQPGNAELMLLIGRNELKANAVPRDSMGIRKLIIPADTEFVVSGIAFTLQYPIEIRQMPHGGIQVVYDTSVKSPIRQLESNALDWEIVTEPFDGKNLELIAIRIPVMQYWIKAYTDQIIVGSGFKRRYSFKNQFFHARVWLRDDINKGWKEIPITHDERVIDPMAPTARVMVMDGEVSIEIPDIYIRNGLARGDVRVDIYETLGKVSMDLQQFDTTAFTIQLKDVGNVVPNMYYKPLQRFTYFAVMATGPASGGRSWLPFEDLRERVINNATGNREEPISDLQLENSLNDKGFNITKSIDMVTERIYLASTEMPQSTIKEVSTPIGTMNGYLETSFEELCKLSTVRNNGKRITIMPDTLYKFDNGIIELDRFGIDYYRGLPPNSLVSILNNSKYLYTPFHYVLDSNSEAIDVRPYYLSRPKVDAKVFVETNTTLGLDVGTGNYSLDVTDFGYRLTVITRSGDNYKNLANKYCRAQLSFTPRGYSKEYAFVNGKYIGRKSDTKERIFEFEIHTNLDIDRNDDMIIDNFILVGDKPTPTPVKLRGDFNIIYSIDSYNTAEYRPCEADSVLNKATGTEKVVTHELLRLNLGVALPTLWTNARIVASTVDYMRYEEDVPAVWKRNIYHERQPGVPDYEVYRDDDNKPQMRFKVKYAKGTPRVKDGVPIILHEKGTVMRHPTGQPMIKEPRKVKHRLDMFLFDGKYLLSNTKATNAYRGLVVDHLLDWLTVDIARISKRLLEKTKLFMYPKSTMGNIQVMLGDGSVMYADAENQFSVKYYLTAAARSNDDLLSTLADVTRSVILTNLKKRTISASAILEDIRRKMGDEIVDVEMVGMGESGKEFIFSIKDMSTKPTLDKKVVVNPDGTIAIKDSISISYFRHDFED